MRDQVHRRFAPFSDLEIEAFLVGDLEAARAARLEAALAESADLAAHVAARRREQAEFARLQPVLNLPADATRRRVIWPWALAASAAVAALLLLLLPPAVSPDLAGGLGPAIRARGALKADLVVRRDGRIFSYREGVLLREGDQLRLTVESPSGGYLTLLGRDARGQTTVYYDGLKTHAGTFTVHDSLVLDGSLEPEEWLVILSEQRVPAEELSQRLLRGEALGAAATAIRIAKEAAP